MLASKLIPAYLRTLPSAARAGLRSHVLLPTTVLPATVARLPCRQFTSAVDDSEEKPMTFIDRAKVYGANALMGAFLTSGTKFDRVLDQMKITSLGDGVVKCEIVTHNGIQNTYNTMHGGAIATLIDVVGTLALLTKDPKRAGVSVEMNISYMSAAKANQVVKMEGRVLKYGKKLGFTEVDLRNEDGTLIATGRHTKAL